MGIFSALERRASPEDPTTDLSQPASWLFHALGGGTTAAGVHVNETTALRYSAVYACINVIAKDIAQLPIFVYERLVGDERREARAHPTFRILHDRPNPVMTPFTFKQTLQAHATSWGNAYAEIQTDGA